MVRIMRHRQTKGPDTDRPDLNHRVTSRLYTFGVVTPRTASLRKLFAFRKSIAIVFCDAKTQSCHGAPYCTRSRLHSNLDRSINLARCSQLPNHKAPARG